MAFDIDCGFVAITIALHERMNIVQLLQQQ